MEEKKITLLVQEWDAVYKKGQLSLWVLLAIFDSKKHAGEITAFMQQATNGNFEVKEQSLYRALRRYTSMGLVSVSTQESSRRGPQLKYYQLTPLGEEVLRRFVDLNIAPLFSPTTSTLIERLKIKGDI